MRFQFPVLLVVALLNLTCASSNTQTAQEATSSMSQRALNWVNQPDEMLVMPWDEPSRLPDRLILNWSDDPATTLSVTWRTDTTVTQSFAQIVEASPSPNLVGDTLRANTEALDLGFINGESVKAHFHNITFTDLAPETLYAYRVGDGINWSSWYQTKTASASTDPFTFIYFGDAQNGLYSHWARTIRMAYTMAPESRFIVHAGDLVNIAHRNTEWGEWFEAAGWINGVLPSIPIPGNHEYQPFQGSIGDRELSAFWRPQFTLPMNGVEGLEETTYFIDYQGVRIIGMNSNLMEANQVEWLDATLQSNPHPWALLTFHHPIFSSAGDRDNPELRKLWKPIIDKHGVDLVMQGHDHTYARGRAFNTTEGSTAQDLSGTVYVNSVSGSKMYQVTANRWKDKGASLERAAGNTQLFQIIDIDADTLNYRAFTANGELYDAFALVKQPAAPNLFIDKSEALGAERLR